MVEVIVPRGFVWHCWWGVYVVSKSLDLTLLNYNFSTNSPMNLKLREKQESLAENSLSHLSTATWHCLALLRNWCNLPRYHIPHFGPGLTLCVLPKSKLIHEPERHIFRRRTWLRSLCHVDLCDTAGGGWMSFPRVLTSLCWTITFPPIPQWTWKSGKNKQVWRKTLWNAWFHHVALFGPLEKLM